MGSSLTNGASRTVEKKSKGKKKPKTETDGGCRDTETNANGGRTLQPSAVITQAEERT